MIGTKSRILLFSGVALGLSVLCYLALHHSVSDGKVSKVYGRDVADGMRVWNPKAGMDSIRFESCRVEKLKSGPITFGGLDVLAVLHNRARDCICIKRDESSFIQQV